MKVFWLQDKTNKVLESLQAQEEKGLVSLLFVYCLVFWSCDRQLTFSSFIRRLQPFPPSPTLHKTSIQETRSDAGDGRKSRERCASAASSSAPHALMLICPLVVPLRHQHFRPPSA